MPADFDTEYTRATDRPPFSNGTEGEAWMDNWCRRCFHDLDGGCTLLLVAFMDLTPVAWVPDQHSALGQQYRCAEYAR